MTQTKKKPLPSGWRSQTIAEIVGEKHVKVGNKKITEELAVDEGTITLIFSGDLQNKQKVQSKRKTTEYILEQALGRPINSIRQNSFVSPNSVLVALARDKAGTVGMHIQGDAVVNSAIATFTLLPGTILPELLFYFFKNPHTREQIKRDFMPGGKPYVKKEDLMTLRINYPPIERQKQMVQQIEALLSEVERARALLQTNQEMIDRLLESIIREVFTRERKDGWKFAKLDDALIEVRSAAPNQFLNGHEGYPCVEADDIDRTVAEIRMNIDTIGTLLPGKTRGFLLDVKPGVLLYANTFTSETHWRSRIALPFYKGESPFEKVRCKDDLFALTVRDTKRLSTRFLFWALQDPDVTALFAGNGQLRGNVRIKSERIETLELRMPEEPDEQERICAYLDAYQEQLHQLRESQRANQIAVDQLEGSILDQIFRED